MKKVFNASLVAASMALAFSAAAATVTPTTTPLKLSAEGVAAGKKAMNQNVEFDVTVDSLHPANSVITLTFDNKVDLDTLAAAAGGAVTNTPGSGQGVSGDITFNYGTGSFTFDAVEVDKDEGTISFKVGLGDPLPAFAAFRVTLGATKVDIAGETSVSYSSKTAAGVPIETGSGVIATETTQFGFAVTTEFSKLIDRTDMTVFNDTTNTDQASFRLINRGNLAAALAGVSATVNFAGNFEDLVPAADFAAEIAGGAALGGAITLNAAENVLSVPVAAAELTAAGLNNNYNLDFALVTAAVDIPETGAIAASVVFASADLPGTGTLTYATGVDAGEWRLDATIVNVPYLPVGYEQFSGNVEISNEGNTDAEIIVRAIGNKKDGNGDAVTYGPVTLSKVAAANSVTTIFERDLMDAFGLAKGDNVKMSVTFIIDADKEDVTLAPYYREGTARINVISDQYKADSIRR